MAVVTIKHKPELTAEAAMSIFQKGFTGKYEVYKWNRPGGVRDFVVKKSNLIGVAVKLKLKGGAGDGTRTRDNLLGRQGLCQLSYSRGSISYILAPRYPHCQSTLLLIA